MADINNDDTPRADGAALRTQAEGGGQTADTATLTELIELFFFAYRDFTGAPDVILREFGFGRAHHRVLHFVNRYPGLRVADLLDILKITKQSLARVLKQLVDEGFIDQQPGKSDRRERRLFATERGRDLARRLIAPQLKRVAEALAVPGGDHAADLNRAFLFQMIDAEDRGRVTDLLAGAEKMPSASAGDSRNTAEEQIRADDAP